LGASFTAAAQPAACTDFYGHVNHAWLARTVLPPDQPRIGSFDELRIANDRLLERAMARLLAEPARQDTPGLKLLATWYGSGLDPVIAQRAGLKAVQPWLDRIAGLRDAAGLPSLLGELSGHRIAVPIVVWVSPDVQDVRRHGINLNQGGLGLPDRDDYLKHDDTSRRLQAAYRVHAGRLLAGAGAPHDGATLDALMAFETELARASMTGVERRDPQATNNRRTLSALRAEAPGFDWAAWFQAMGITPGERELGLSQPKFAQALARMAGSTPLPVWQSYLRVQLLDTLAPWLAPRFQQTHFQFHDQVQRGLLTPPARHEQLLRLIAGGAGWEPLSQTVGELFVREAFSPRAQQRAGQLIDDVRSAMRTRIRGLPWMSEPTKQRALAKLDAMVPQVGAPERWPDYAGLVLDPQDPAGNQLRVNAWASARDAARLAQPVDRLRWATSPHIVNAFAGDMNRIIFPAGILQPPFFDAEGDDAANYGGIGMVIGHEIIHHFDDRGRQYDATGNLADWWAPEDAAAYRARADRAVALYSQHEPLPGLRLNGRQMLGENISDLGGLQIAYDAYRIALARQPAPGTGGRTPEQRFFINNAVIWRSKQRAEALEQQIRTGQHSPAQYRVGTPMAQMPAFAAAFGCRPGDAMVAADPVAIW
jgi:predicted metalloendopeptidase